MLRTKLNAPGTMKLGKLAPAGFLMITLGAAGCSADFTRFDGLGANGDTTTGSIERQGGFRPTSLSDQTPGSTDYEAPPVSLGVDKSGSGPTGTDRVTTSSLPRSDGTRKAPERTIKVADAAPRSDDTRYGGTVTGSGRVTVQSGDTLYGIARRHSVSVAAIKSANNLTSNTIRPGQSLILPGSNAAPGSGSVSRTVKRPDLPRSAQPSSTFEGETYTVRGGDSLYRISRLTGVSVDDLKDWNGITDVRRVMPGRVLKLQPSGAPVANEQSATRRTVKRSSGPKSLQSKTANTRNVEVVNRPRKRSQTDSAPRRTMSDAVPNQPKPGDQVAKADPSGDAGDARFRWPARGRIVSKFGKRSDGSHNDGIDISVPRGTDVLAAEDGVVAYADNQLKAYGNLILVRHDNGWVSAYAHADKMLVNRGDRVSRGQVIAKAGDTGAVETPTVHFELRDGSKPVDPLPLLPRGMSGA